MAHGKKSIEMADAAGRAFYRQVSKAFLADLVTDLVRRNAGQELLDGLALVDAIVAQSEAITSVRGDARAVASGSRAAAMVAAKTAPGIATPEPAPEPRIAT